MLRLTTQSLIAFAISTSALAHDDLRAREKEFRYGYQVGYITAVRESNEGSVMCTKDVALLEVIQTLGAYNKSKGLTGEAALTATNVTEALSVKYKCPRK
jgi:hypothetical protein